MIKTTEGLLEFWEEQMRQSHRSSNYFFRKSPSHYHMMLIVMAAYKSENTISVEELKTQLFKTSRPKSALIINEACEKGFFFLQKTRIFYSKKNNFLGKAHHSISFFVQSRIQCKMKKIYISIVFFFNFFFLKFFH